MEGLVNYGSDDELESPNNAAECRSSIHRNKNKSRTRRRSRSANSSASSEPKEKNEGGHRSYKNEKPNDKDTLRSKDSEKYSYKSKRDYRECATNEYKQAPRDRDRIHERYHRNVRDGDRSQRERERHEKNDRNYDNKSNSKDSKNERDYAYYKQERRKSNMQEYSQFRRHRESDSRGSKHDNNSSYTRKDARRSRSPSTSQQNSLERKRRYKSRSNSPVQKTKSHKSRESDQYNGRNTNLTQETTLTTTTTTEPTIQKKPSSAGNALMNVLTTNKVDMNPPQLPKYYNPSVVNPSKYAEQIQKRKLLWSGKKGEDNATKWGTAQFSQDSDGKVASKFMRLMGIKNSSGPAEQPDTNTDAKSREEMFSSMEQQYEVARQATHTMRGVGLGFSSQSRLF